MKTLLTPRNKKCAKLKIGTESPEGNMWLKQIKQFGILETKLNVYFCLKLRHFKRREYDSSSQGNDQIWCLFSSSYSPLRTWYTRSAICVKIASQYAAGKYHIKK